MFGVVGKVKGLFGVEEDPETDDELEVERVLLQPRRDWPGMFTTSSPWSRT